MEQVKKLLESIQGRLSGTAMKDAVASKPLTVGNQHVLVLSELSIGFGAGGGSGEGPGPDKGCAKGTGGGGGGGAKANPVAVVVVEQDKVRLEKIGN
jgi:uncharacterized spore protein YtfJ